MVRQGFFSIRALLLLFFFVCSVLAAGSWYNLSEIQRVIGGGYGVTAQITGGKVTGKRLPFSFSGSRLHFLDQEQSIDLSWSGKDGVSRRASVPVTPSFWGSIAEGNALALVPVQVTVLDDESAVPVVAADAAARTASLRSKFDFMSYGAAGFLFAVLVFSILGRILKADLSRVQVPFIPAVLGLLLIGFGLFMAVEAWISRASMFEILDRGVDTIGEIASATRSSSASEKKASYLAEIVWKDKAGASHRFGPTHVSEQFWYAITQGGVLKVKQTLIRYLPDRPEARPIIVADVAERAHQTLFGLVMGAAFVLVGLGFAWRVVSRIRRQLASA